ncbi:class I SAM-dependent methyltransferase [Zunongwangia sp. SCSIO 43204]|uniref:class I SAM-dependent methyltransferase n=1 Tax=Zunongwangia sp. SCSIO 43204 TaxID=2779359 RepID=UPI001CA850CA|nr:class I SAM-dependent methyltransferase [Zunongwangia sp. SCSIO 43204]UAB82817.1 class I SAM-dependent methyltransferase [Zunongwangia sp. SCSIO 43204]
MKNDRNIGIHETAFVTSAFRATDENLSQDTFARLWQNSKTDQWIIKYLKQVSSEEPFTHCLRNRYFLDEINALVQKNEIDVLINFGSGFSMYPFLLDKKLMHIEIDKPEIVTYKRQKLEHWQQENVLPKRDIHFIGVDFTSEYKSGLITKLNAIKGNKSCFILIEGVLFFLNREETNDLFELFKTVQNSGDYIGSASFQETIKDTQAFKNLLHFFNLKVAKTSKDDYQTIDDRYYTSVPNYTLIDQQDYFSLSKKYDHKVREKRTLILNENFYLLKKN